MSKVVVKVNRAGLVELRQSQEVQNMLNEYGKRIASAAGLGYSHTVKVMPTRAVCFVQTTTSKAMKENLHGNALLKAMRSV